MHFSFLILFYFNDFFFLSIYLSLSINLALCYCCCCYASMTIFSYLLSEKIAKNVHYYKKKTIGIHILFFFIF